MKYVGSLNLWNTSQWRHIIRPANLFSIKKQDDGVFVVTILGFVIFVD